MAITTVAAGCGQAATTTPTAPSSQPATAIPPASSPTVTLPPKPTAADGLAAYFASARRASARIHEAAQEINGELGSSGTPTFSRATKNAVERADPWFAAAQLPGGLKPDLEWAVLRVQNDLEARWYAFRLVTEPFSSPGQGRSDLMRCLSGGATAAAQFSTDLRKAQRLAAASPPFVAAKPNSRSAAEVAIELQTIMLANGGCASCGGYLFGSMPVVVWHPAHIGVMTWDGTVGHIPFRARYAAGSGWHVQLNAC